MLVELRVSNLGVIAEVRIPLGEGLVALTGETGAGKTMVVEALALLAGGRPDPGRVRVGADEAVIEGLFASGDDEYVLRRVVPASGRSRAYVDGNLVTAARLGEVAGELIELHGQHSQQELLHAGAQRAALDRFCGVDRDPLVSLGNDLRRTEEEIVALHGDDAALRREAEWLRHQVDEVGRVAPRPGEDAELAAEEDLLVGAVEHRSAGALAFELLSGEGAALDQLAAALAALGDREVYSELVARFSALSIEVDDAVSELRSVAESIEPDTERLEQVRQRRHELASIRRVYGDDLEEVLAATEAAARRLSQVDSLDERRAELASRRESTGVALEEEGRRVGSLRRGGVDELARRVEAVLVDLAMPHASVEVAVRDTDSYPHAGESVELRLSAGPGSPHGPLQRVASGGELSRVMLALRLVLSGGPPSMVFDEVDAGIGGEAALAVGAALSQLAAGRQVLVVTHLPQVAAHADRQLRVTKQVDGTVTVTTVEALGEDDRVIELSRMLSGNPTSTTAREHASELLADAARARGR